MEKEISHLLQSTTLRRPLALEANSKLKNLFVWNQFWCDRKPCVYVFVCMRIRRFGEREKKDVEKKLIHISARICIRWNRLAHAVHICRHTSYGTHILCQPMLPLSHSVTHTHAHTLCAYGISREKKRRFERRKKWRKKNIRGLGFWLHNQHIQTAA